MIVIGFWIVMGFWIVIGFRIVMGFRIVFGFRIVIGFWIVIVVPDRDCGFAPVGEEASPFEEASIVIAKLLLFFYGGIEFPAVAVGAQGHFCVCVLEGDVVTALAIPVEFEEVGDPVGTELFLEAAQQIEG
jgi:hypothetical protein